MNDTPLRLDRVTRVYKQAGRELIVFRDVSLTLKPGEIVALVGQSGAGKSSLLHIAGLLEEPTSGEVYINGQAASHLPERARTETRRETLGFVYQAHHLLPEFTALENVAMPRRIAGESRDEAAKEARRLLTMVGLGERLDHRPSQLSGGEQQRVAIARALAYNPAVLLMDEPFAALDALTRDDMQRLLADVWRETRKTIIYVTHNVAEAVYLADRVVVMTPHPGRVKALVDIALPRPRDPLSIAFLEYQKDLLNQLGHAAKAPSEGQVHNGGPQ
jgi:ABC-type nitrate/sulfonate/bicarbonate transport system ATPase subunit